MTERIIKPREPVHFNKPYRVLVTGSRKWTDKVLFEAALRSSIPWGFEDIVLIIGAAKGLDWIAEEFAVEEGIKCELYPANWKKLGKKAGGPRNQQMVDSGADICLAFPLDDSIGTWDCMRRAEAAGIRVVRFHADGLG